MAASEHGAGFKLRILHFNDVYSIGEKPEGKPCGGIPRFQTLIKARRQQAAEDGVACLTCFSGDALFPSTLSTLTQAKQMVDALNLTIGDHGVSGVGNHDADGGLEIMASRFGECKFPWLLSNVRDRESGRPWRGLREFVVVDVPIPAPGTTVPPKPSVIGADETRRIVEVMNKRALSHLSPPPTKGWKVTASDAAAAARAAQPATPGGASPVSDASGAGEGDSSPPATPPTTPPPPPTATPVTARSPSGAVPARHVRVGVICLAEYAWLETLTTVSLDQVDFEPPADCARRLCPVLREQLRCDVIVALAHMRLPNDRALAFEAQRHVDVVLSGHDHDLAFEMCGAVPVIKSGTEFWWLSQVDLDGSAMESPEAAAERIAAAGGRRDYGSATAPSVSEDTMQGGWSWGEGDAGDMARGVQVVPGLSVPSELTSSRLPRGPHRCSKPRCTVTLFETRTEHPADPEAAAVLHKWEAQVEEKLKVVIGETAEALDARFSEVRTKETNVGSLLADLMRQSVNADCAILNGGTLRANAVIGPGKITMRHVVSLLPMQDAVVKLKVTGEQLVAALENGVSKWPALEGRFPQVSGIRFTFDPAMPPGERVLLPSVRVRGKLLLSPDEARADDCTVTDFPTDGSVSSSGTSLSSKSEGPRVTPPAAVQLRRTHSWVPYLTDEGRTPAAQLAAIAAAVKYGRGGSDDRDEAAEAVAAGMEGGATPVVHARAAGDEAVMSWAEALAAEGSSGAAQGDGWRAKEFTLATKAYLATGRDGYTSLAEADVLIDEENGPLIPALLQSHMTALSCLNGMDLARHHSSRRAALSVMRRFVRRRRTRRSSAAPASGAGSGGAAASASSSAGSPTTLHTAAALGLSMRHRRPSMAMEASRDDGLLPTAGADLPIPEGCTVPFVLKTKHLGRIGIVGRNA